MALRPRLSQSDMEQLVGYRDGWKRDEVELEVGDPACERAKAEGWSGTSSRWSGTVRGKQEDA
jgi:hypothetical protein